MSEQYGAKMVAIKAGRSAILHHASRKWLREEYGRDGAYLMPNALKLPESVTETALEVGRTKLPTSGTLVVSISSGTIAAGVLRGFRDAGLLDGYQVILHMGYSRNPDACHMYIKHMMGLSERIALPNVAYIDENYEYADKVQVEAPFPTNPYYDGKAWKWLVGHIDTIAPGPIVFWNVGD